MTTKLLMYSEVHIIKLLLLQSFSGVIAALKSKEKISFIRQYSNLHNFIKKDKS